MMSEAKQGHKQKFNPSPKNEVEPCKGVTCKLSDLRCHTAQLCDWGKGLILKSSASLVCEAKCCLICSLHSKGSSLLRCLISLLHLGSLVRTKVQCTCLRFTVLGKAKSTSSSPRSAAKAALAAASCSSEVLLRSRNFNAAFTRMAGGC